MSYFQQFLILQPLQPFVVDNWRGWEGLFWLIVGIREQATVTYIRISSHASAVVGVLQRLASLPAIFRQQ